ncbi:hypothetical protein D934_12220 [Xylella fastidiosa subsp. sandyi Ann-1]|uniref:Uncharacterized protein n=1 Tax=Xylella fastidiosa subsp. sandyi Ann-1 TaxID=155920 RepID=A0A060H7P6_XYLFS|nr:hypothetical protein D934_12220 [Xylella fastidiosa subsp. sandyi Ann-1]
MATIHNEVRATPVFAIKANDEAAAHQITKQWQRAIKAAYFDR